MFDLAVESRRTLVACVGVLFGAFALVYLPDVGHGLLKDDFGWIAQSFSLRAAMSVIVIATFGIIAGGMLAPRDARA